MGSRLDDVAGTIGKTKEKANLFFCFDNLRRLKIWCYQCVILKFLRQIRAGNNDHLWPIILDFYEHSCNNRQYA
jgi:hypothetical protein